MLVKGTEVIGSKVFTIDDGRLVEDIDDVIYNPNTNRVEALLVSPSGIFSEAKLILLKNATGVGKDAVLIQNEDIMKSASEIPSNLSAIVTRGDYLTENRIITEAGVDLGKVVDILFDSQTGEVEEFIVSQGLKDVATGRKYVKVSDIITVGHDAVIVKGYTEKTIAEQAKKGGIVGAATKGAETLKTRGPQYLERARIRAEELVQKAKEEAEYFKNRSVQAIQTTKPKLKRTGRKIKRTTKKISP